jgi:hypothetical protein
MRTFAKPRATAQVGQAKGRTLIFGGGDEAGASLGINPTESLTNLEDLLTNAGYGVDVSATLPKRIVQYKAIWFLDTNPLTASQESELESYVDSGHGLYLTGGPDDCCGALNTSDTAVIDSLTGSDIQAGGQGDADDANAPNSINTSAIDDIAENPSTLTGWTPDGPGGMSGVGQSNILTSTTFTMQPTPTGAVWDGSSLQEGTGRLAILMNINWLESEFWNQTTAAQMAVNLERFLMAATPVRVANNPQWAGYAAKAHGVSDVTGEWTVPSVDCSQDSDPSAVGVWVGIDGFGNKKLVKAGVGVTCTSPAVPPCYYFFTEVLPGTESPIPGPGGACGGASPGDAVSVDVTNSPFGSSSFIISIIDNGEAVTSPITVTAPSKRDKSAECVVQLPPGDVGPTPAHYTELADFSSVTFTQCQATATQNAGDSLDVDQLPSGSDGAFAVTTLNMGTHTVPKAMTVPPSDFSNLAWTVNWVAAG